MKFFQRLRGGQRRVEVRRVNAILEEVEGILELRAAKTDREEYEDAAKANWEAMTVLVGALESPEADLAALAEKYASNIRQFGLLLAEAMPRTDCCDGFRVHLTNGLECHICREPV